MIYLLVALLYAFILLLFLVSVISIYLTLSSGFMKNPPLIVSSGENYKSIVRRVSKRIRKCEVNDFKMPFTILDAGCGIGTLIIPLAKEFKEHKFVGVEYSWLPYFIAKFRARNLKNVEILHQNLFDYDFSDVNMIMCFLMGKLMNKFTDKCKNELKKKSYIFANRFELVDFEPIETMDLGDNFNYIYLYKYLPKNAIPE